MSPVENHWKMEVRVIDRIVCRTAALFDLVWLTPSVHCFLCNRYKRPPSGTDARNWTADPYSLKRFRASTKSSQPTPEIELTGTNGTFDTVHVSIEYRSSSMATGTKPADAGKRFYIWSAPGRKFSIHLSLSVVEKMTRELLHAAIGHPARDISGVLLGHSLPAPYPATVVDEFVFESGQAVNESSASTADDDTVSEMSWRLVREAESGRHIVGFFRSQRDGPLFPNDLDLTNASRLRGETDNVLLLIRLLESGECEAAFFYWEGGNTQYHASTTPFPFDATLLPSASLSGPGKFSPGMFEQFRLPPAIGAHAASEASLWLRLLPTFALFGLVTAGIQMSWPSRTVEATQMAELATADASPLGLKVAAQPHQLEIHWNLHSTQILAAEKAIVAITEGDVTEKIPIDRQELRDGYVAYTPKTNDVYVRFEVTGADGGSTTESVRVVAIP